MVEVAYAVAPGKTRPDITAVWVNGRQGGDAVHSDISRAARKALQSWTFTPGTRGLAQECATFTMSSTGSPLLGAKASACVRGSAEGYALPVLTTPLGAMDLSMPAS